MRAVDDDHPGARLVSRGAADSIDVKVHQTGPRPVIVIGLPSFGMVHLFFMARYYNLRMPMNTIQKHIYVVGKEVGDARNEIVAKALSLEEADPSIKCSKIFFLDDDVLVHPDALLKLLQHDRPIISGLYYTKCSVPTPLVLHDEYSGTAKDWIPGEVVECHGHGMGLTLIDAEVFRRVRDELSIGVDAHGYPAWFQTTKDAAVLGPGGVRQVKNQTEDMRFLELARQLGYTTAVDTSAQAFGWHLDTKTLTAYPEKQWREFCETGRCTWETEHGLVRW
jgi:hypothetical protein